MTTISRTISYRHPDGPYAGLTGAVKLVYDTDRPHDVRLDFGPDGEWTIWRDILARRTTGQPNSHIDGNVWYGGATCRVEGQWFYLTLSEYLGATNFQMLPATVDKFLADTEKLVPYGTEQVDVDAMLAGLLGGAR